MDAVNDPLISEIVVMSCTQLLKTEFLLNVLGYHTHQDPAPILLIQPTLEMAESFSKERLAPMIRDTPVLTGLFADPKARDSGNTLRKKQFPGGYIQLAGANSPSSLAMRAVRIALLDEVDRYPLSAGAEGDPVKIVSKRLKTFWNRLLVLVSSPTEKGVSRIELALEGSDYRQCFVTCVHCREPQVMRWEAVKWPKGEPRKAQYHCVHCAAPWTEPARLAALARHEWRPTRRPEVHGRAGFWANELYSPWVTPADMATDFLEAKRSNETLKTFVNTSLAESWETPGEALEPEPLYARREPYPAAVPNGSVLTAGVDVQADRVEVEIVSWGTEEESWGVEYLRLYGDPHTLPLWDALARALSKLYQRADDETMQVGLVCIDSGYATDEVHAFCKRNPRRYVPTKGYAQAGHALFDFPRKPGKHRTYLTMIGTETAKDIIHGRLQALEPGPGYCHWPVSDDFDREYFAQLTAERREKRYKKGHPYFQWVQTRPRNEALDCRVGALVALRILRRHSQVIPSSVTLGLMSSDHPSVPGTALQTSSEPFPLSDPPSRRGRRARRGLFPR